MPGPKVQAGFKVLGLVGYIPKEMLLTANQQELSNDTGTLKLQDLEALINALATTLNIAQSDDQNEKEKAMTTN